MCCTVRETSVQLATSKYNNVRPTNKEPEMTTQGKITAQSARSPIIRHHTRNAYDIQELRIATGLRLFALFRDRFGGDDAKDEPEVEIPENATPEEAAALRSEAAEKADRKRGKIINQIKESYDRVTDGIALESRKKNYKFDNVIQTEAEILFIQNYLDLLANEKEAFKRLDKALRTDDFYVSWLSNVKGIGPAMAGVIISELDPFKAKYPSSFWKYCFPGNTLVATPNSQVAIKKLKVGSRVVNADGEIGVVQETKKRYFSGDLVTIKATGTLPFKATDEHPVLVARDRASTPAWVAAKDIRIGDYLLVPKLQLADAPTSLEWEAPPRAIGRNPKLGMPLELTEDVLYLFGRFLADGCASLFTEGKYERGICMIADGKEQLPELQHLVEIIEDAIGAARVVELDRSYRIDFGKLYVAKKFAQWFGRKAHRKHIPEFIMNLTDPALILSFVRGYFFGDGHVVSAGKSRGSIVASSASKKLILQLQLLLTKVDVFASIHEQHRASGVTEILGRPVNQRRMRYCLSLPTSAVRQLFPDIEGKDINRSARKAYFDDTHWRVAVTDIEYEQVEDLEVYNLRVSNGNTYLVNNLAVHNCGLDVVNIFDKETGELITSEGRSRKKTHLVESTYRAADGTEQVKMGLSYNPWIKTKLLAVVASSFMKSKNEKYTTIYENYKFRQLNRPELQDKKGIKAIAHKRATRYMIKMFLIDLHCAWRAHYGLEVYPSYAEAKLGLTHGRDPSAEQAQQ